VTTLLSPGYAYGTHATTAVVGHASGTGATYPTSQYPPSFTKALNRVYGYPRY
jgi:hypothetical protein